MDKLKAIIGPAPSEMPLEALVQKIALERARISKELTFVPAKRKVKTKSSRSSTAAKTPKAKKTLSAADLARLSQLAGIDLKTGKKLTP